MKYTHFIFDIDGTFIDTEKTGVPSSKAGGMLGYHDSVEFLELWEENFIRLLTFIDHSVCAEDCDKHKPDPEYHLASVSEILKFQ